MLGEVVFMKCVLKSSIPIFLVLFSKHVLEIKHWTTALESVGSAFKVLSGVVFRFRAL